MAKRINSRSGRRMLVHYRLPKIQAEKVMGQKAVIKKTAEFVKKTLGEESTGHDWRHVYRVWQTAKHISKYEKANIFIVELAALLHDIADWKFHGGDKTIGPKTAASWLRKLKVEAPIIDRIYSIIENISFKGAGVKTKMKTIEGKIVQDADRLDALGAIGIARAFAYGASKNRKIYDPKIKPVLHKTAKHYINSSGTTINHFYEKLLLLKDRMNTKTGKKLATERHNFLEEYLKRFYKEWNFQTPQTPEP